MLLMVVSALLFSTMSLLVKLLGDINPFLVTFVRFFIGLLVITILVLSRTIEIKPKNYRWLVIRGVFGALAVLLLYFGITRIGLGKGTLLNYTYPVFAAMLAPLFLKEKNTARIWLMQLIALSGCYLLLNPVGLFHFNGIDLLVLAGGFFSGVAVNSIRLLTRTESTFTIFLSFCLFSCLMYVYPAFHHLPPLTIHTWLVLIVIGILGTAGQLIMTYGYKFTPVNEGSLVAFLVPTLNVILGVLFFAESMSMNMILGSILVIGSCIYTTLYKPANVM
jgi:drug/metabolite transporter (DMT)-like permease